MELLPAAFPSFFLPKCAHECGIPAESRRAKWRFAYSCRGAVQLLVKLSGARRQGIRRGIARRRRRTCKSQEYLLPEGEGEGGGGGAGPDAGRPSAASWKSTKSAGVAGGDAGGGTGARGRNATSPRNRRGAADGERNGKRREGNFFFIRLVSVCIQRERESGSAAAGALLSRRRWRPAAMLLDFHLTFGVEVGQIRLPGSRIRIFLDIWEAKQEGRGPMTRCDYLTSNLLFKVPIDANGKIILSNQ